jgi:small subunit ribosomal protein S4e
MHLKRQKSPKNWPIYRKGTKYIVRPRSNIEKGLPLLVILRDVLRIAQNRKEVKRALHEKQILVNNKIARDERSNVLLLETISILPLKKHYRLGLSDKGKFEVKEIKENEVNQKISKIVNKKILKGKKTQLNLSDGRNFISDIKCNINDSAKINLKEKKIEGCLGLKEKAKVLVFAGKHTGERGTIKKINQEKKMAELNINKKIVNTLISQFMVIE